MLLCESDHHDECEVEQEEEAGRLVEGAEPEERELYTAEEMDDPEIQLAIAMSLEQEG